MNKYKIIIAILILVLVAGFLSKCENDKTANNTIKALQSEISHYKLKNGKLASSVQTIEFDKAQLKEMLKNESETVRQLSNKFSKVNTVTKIVESVKIDTILIAYQDSIPCDFEIKGSVFREWYNMAYKSNQHGIDIYELSIPDSVSIITGTKRKWLFGKETKTLDIVHSNPFIMTDKIQHIELKEKKKFYQTDLFKIGIGLIGGFMIAK